MTDGASGEVKKDGVDELARRFLTAVALYEEEWGPDYMAIALKEINTCQMWLLEVSERPKAQFSPLVKVLEGIKGQVEEHLFDICQEDGLDDVVERARTVFARALEIRAEGRSGD